MPHTNSKPRPAPIFSPSEFVNINLTPDQKAAIKAAAFDLVSFDASIERLLDGGYKLTVRFDDRNDCYASWLVAPATGQNKGKILAGRGSTPLKALKQLLYIHTVVLEGDWDTAQDQSATVLDD